MNNFGFISKKRVAREIAKIVNNHTNPKCSHEEFIHDCGAHSALNFLCDRLRIKPMHLHELSGGTGEMFKQG